MYYSPCGSSMFSHRAYSLSPIWRELVTLYSPIFLTSSAIVDTSSIIDFSAGFLIVGIIKRRIFLQPFVMFFLRLIERSSAAITDTFGQDAAVSITICKTVFISHDFPPQLPRMIVAHLLHMMKPVVQNLNEQRCDLFF